MSKVYKFFFGWWIDKIFDLTEKQLCTILIVTWTIWAIIEVAVVILKAMGYK